MSNSDLFAAAALAFEISDKIGGYSEEDIRLHAGEMTAQEMRTVRAIQRWWVDAIRKMASDNIKALDEGA